MAGSVKKRCQGSSWSLNSVPTSQVYLAIRMGLDRKLPKLASLKFPISKVVSGWETTVVENPGAMSVKPTFCSVSSD
jgi:hypothetical protein